MAKPFANSARFNGDIIGTYIFAIQTGTLQNADGLAQMKYITLEQFAAYLRKSSGSVWNFRGNFSSALPTNPVTNDYFYASGTFTVSGNTYTQGHLYAYNGTGWNDISNVLTQYALASDVQAIDDRLTLAESRITALSGGIVPKGNITSTELANITPSSANVGWLYFVTDLNIYKVSDGNDWIPFGSYPIYTFALRSSFPATGVVKTIYIAEDEKKVYYWNGTAYVSEIDDLIDGTKTAKKAERDASGNVITTTYATKTELTAKANNLQTQITNNYGEIQNIKTSVLGVTMQEVTDSTQANVKTISDANVLPWGIMKRVGARSTQFNQWIKKDYTYNQRQMITDYHLHLGDVAGNAWYPFTDSITFISGHKYFIGFSNTVNNLASGSYFLAGNFDYYDSAIFTGDGSSGRLAIVTSASTTTSNSFDADVMFVDLTLMGMYDSNITDAQNIANFKAKYPSSYYPYNAGDIIPLNPSAFKVVGKNIWNQLWEMGDITSETGVGFGSDHAIRCVGYIHVEPSKTYYFLVSSAYSLKMRYYDGDKNFIGNADANGAYNAFNNARVMPSNCHYIRFAIDNTTSYNKTVQICDNTLSVEEKTTFEDYHETTIDTSFLADKKYVNSSCHDYSENVYVNGVPKRRDRVVVGSYTFDGSESWSDRGTNQAGATVFSIDVTSFIPYYLGVDIGIGYNCAVSLGPTTGIDYVINKSDTKGIYYYYKSGDPDRLLYVVGLTRTERESLKVTYELATPSYTDNDTPIPNFPVENGTTITAVTPQTDVVNAIDVPSTIITESRISA